MKKALVALSAASALAILVPGTAEAAFTLKVIDNADDCGDINSVAFDGTNIHLAWVCNTASGDVVKYAKGTPGGTSFPKEIISDVTTTGTKFTSVASNGGLVFEVNGSIRYARPVAAGTGDCPDNDAWSCELVGSGHDPQISVGPSNVYITYHNDSGSVIMAKRSGIATYTFTTVFTGSSGVSGRFPLIDASDTTAGVWIGYEHDVSSGFASEVSMWSPTEGTESATGLSHYILHGMSVNHGLHQPQVVSGNKLYVRASDGSWSSSTYATSATSIGDVDDYGGYQVITRGGTNGLIATKKGIFGGWTDVLVDGAIDSGFSSLVVNQSNGAYYISYYDQTNQQLKLARGS
ncbi:MAG: hypothetical protein HOW73_19755 [Polyangiaceae bacterium]|nr:hypothetical protein [Polyangiaceae bacterium]